MQILLDVELKDKNNVVTWHDLKTVAFQSIKATDSDSFLQYLTFGNPETTQKQAESSSVLPARSTTEHCRRIEKTEYYCLGRSERFPLTSKTQRSRFYVTFPLTTPESCAWIETSTSFAPQWLWFSKNCPKRLSERAPVKRWITLFPWLQKSRTSQTCVLDCVRPRCLVDVLTTWLLPSVLVVAVSDLNARLKSQETHCCLWLCPVSLCGWRLSSNYITFSTTARFKRTFTTEPIPSLYFSTEKKKQPRNKQKERIICSLCKLTCGHAY